MYDLLKSHLAEKRRKATCRRSDGKDERGRAGEKELKRAYRRL